jgi:uncharacterized protein
MTPLPRSEYVSLTTFRRTYGVRFTVGNATARLWHRLLRRPGDRHELIRISPPRS